MAVLVCRLLPLCWETPSFEALLNDRSAQVVCKIRLEDIRLSKTPSLEMPRRIRAKLLELSFPGSEEKHPCSGQISVYSHFPLPRSYGAVLQVRGVLKAPASDLARREWLLLAESWEKAGQERSWRYHILKIRDKLLDRLCSSIRDDTNRNLAAAFYLGTTGGLDLERRKDFIAAGTVHLFAVSGLHVGMAALLLLTVLRFLPFRWRCFTTAAGVWFYVLLSGAAVPALRAGVMLSVYLFCRGMLFTVPPLRLMGIAAGLIIISDPGSLSSIGFQYSFLITAALLLLAERLKELYQLESRLFTIMPFTPFALKKKKFFNQLFALKAALFSGVTALLAGTVVSLYHSLALVPGSVVANWFTLPVLGVLFALFPVKLAASFHPAADRMAAQCIDTFFDYLRTVAEVMAELCAPFHAFPPGAWTAALMAFLLLGALSFRKNRYALASGGAFLVLLMLFPLLSYLEPSGVTVISSGSNIPPSVLISDKGTKEITVVNPTREHDPDLETALKRSGSSKIHEVAFSHPSVRNLTGLRYLALRRKVVKVVLPPVTGRDWQFLDRITENGGGFYYVSKGLGGEKLKFFRKKNKFAIEYPDSGVMLGWKLEISDSAEGRVIELIQHGKMRKATLPWSNKNGVLHYEL